MAKNKALEEIKEQLDQGIQELMTSEKFQEWLTFLSSFLLTTRFNIQNPQATLVKGSNDMSRKCTA